MDDIQLFLADEDGEETLSGGLAEDALAEADAPPDDDDSAPLSFRASDEDPNDLYAQGWGLIAPEGPAGDRLLQVIQPLIDKRSQDQDMPVTIYRVPPDMDHEQCLDWVDKVLEDPDADVADIPAYLCVLGGMDQVSLALQQVAAIESYVGRIGFDQESQYESYVAKLLHWENRSAERDRGRALFFSSLDGTGATTVAQKLLIEPTVADARRFMEEAKANPRKDRFPASELLELSTDRYENDPTGLLEHAAINHPSVLFSMSHGAGAPKEGWTSTDHQRQVQGAVSLGGGEKIMGADVADRPFLPGGLWFLFACYGAGTPNRSAYFHWLEKLREQKRFRGKAERVLHGLPDGDERPFMANLPGSALANEHGPLAVMGHLDLAWSYSFQDPGRRGAARYKRFQDVLRQMVSGSRAGIALHELLRGRRQLDQEMAVRADAAAADTENPEKAARLEDGHRWMLRADLDGYVLLGDPAAKLNLAPRATAVRSAVTAAPAPAPVPIQVQSAPKTAPTGPDVDTMEQAVHDLLIGEAGMKALEGRYGVGRKDLREWEAIYTEAGRAALQKHRGG